MLKEVVDKDGDAGKLRMSLVARTEGFLYLRPAPLDIKVYIHRPL